MDFDVDPSEVHPLPPGELAQDSEWIHYPQSLFRNWTYDQVERCGILKITHHETCWVHKVDVFKNGSFDRSEEDRTVKIKTPRDYWNRLETHVSSAYVLCLYASRVTCNSLLQIFECGRCSLRI